MIDFGEVKTKQYYSKYTTEDHNIWKYLFNRQYENLKTDNKAVMEFFSGLNALGIDENIPKFSDINKKLKAINGWSIVAVKGLVDDKLFFECLRNKIFPVTTWLRTKDNLDYIEEPDMFHDLFGHVPFLVNHNYVHFLERIGHHGKHVFDNNDKLTQHKMSRLYWYTIEFGLVKANGKFKIYGSGIISSYQESIKALSDNSEKKYYNNEILDDKFYKHDLQEFYVWINKNIKFLNKIRVEDI